jgi:hypothetical protein
MRTKIRVDNKWYRPVPWLKDADCDGCALGQEGCVNTAERDNPCDDGNEFSGMILIPATKEAMAEYVAKKLGADDEDSVE